MKELTIQEKAKAYDDIIERIKDFQFEYRFSPFSDVIGDKFPELKESEDEKVRKEIIDFIYDKTDTYELREKSNSWLAWLEKQGEQKPADKVELKFKVGDWVAINPELRFASPLCIRDIDNNNYRVESADGNSGAPTIDYLDNHYHLWTIQDAKDGDVLCTYECCKPKIVFILKGTPKKHYALSYHCYYNIMYPHFASNSEKGCLAPNDEDVKPATKEQRDLLFKKMHEAGYEWDAEKKELKKIEQESTWNEKVKGLNEIETYILSLVPDRPLDAIKVDAKNIRYIINKKQKPAWSEEDKKVINFLLELIYEQDKISPQIPSYEKRKMMLSWLNSLKDRVQPKQEWSEEGKQYLKIEGYKNLSDYEKIFDDIADKYVRNKNQKGYNQSWYVKERAAEMLYHAKKELEKKESWSEEDVRNIQDIDSVLFYDKSLSEDTCMRLRNWLKSLRPQNRWKPSDEQIHYLSWIANVKLGDSVVEQEVSKHLNELLEDLKKLREE